MTGRYDHLGYIFTTSEIDQVVRLLDPGTVSSLAPIDGRTMTKNVRRWGLTNGALTKADWKGNRRIFHVMGFRPVDQHLVNLPAEAAFRVFVRHIFRPTGGLDGIASLTQGYSITKSPGWEWVQLWPNGNRYGADDLERMVVFLNYLDQNRYIYFRTAGTVWEIAVRDRDAYRRQEPVAIAQQRQAAYDSLKKERTK